MTKARGDRGVKGGYPLGTKPAEEFGPVPESWTRKPAAKSGAAAARTARRAPARRKAS